MQLKYIIIIFMLLYSFYKLQLLLIKCFIITVYKSENENLYQI